MEIRLEAINEGAIMDCIRRKWRVKVSREITHSHKIQEDGSLVCKNWISCFINTGEIWGNASSVHVWYDPDKCGVSIHESDRSIHSGDEYWGFRTYEDAWRFGWRMAVSKTSCF